MTKKIQKSPEIHSAEFSPLSTDKSISPYKNPQFPRMEMLIRANMSFMAR